MICIFCGSLHESERYMCEMRQSAMIRRIVIQSTKKVSKPVQTTIPELYRKFLNKETFIVNEHPIAILDSDDEDILPQLVSFPNELDIDTYRQPTSTDDKGKFDHSVILLY